MANLIDYYNNYDEDKRLVKDRVHKIEYFTTTYILDKYIKSGETILDDGAGTGRYSFYYASKGCRVEAVDIVPKHVNIMKEKIEKSIGLDMNAYVGDATDLSQFKDESFDAVLCLGPMYHLKKQEDRDKCISESLRVLKKGGYLAVAYINKLFITTMLIKENSKYLDEELLNEVIENGTTGNLKDDFLLNSNFFIPEELEKYMEGFGVTKVTDASTDGISIYFPDMVKNFSDEDYEKWLKYHFKICSQPSILGYSNHCLYLCRK